MMRPRPASSLQKTYDECYLACSTAVYFEGQNNEEEALRSWRSALETIYHHNARRVPPNYTPKSETERALQDSIRALEVQCRERVDLLGALQASRKESTEANGSKAYGSKESATLFKGKSIPSIPPPSSSNTPGWIGDGTIPAVGYTDLSKPAAIPGRPMLSTKQSYDLPPIYDDAGPATLSAAGTPALRVHSNSSGKTRSRGSSPERRKPMLTTLRSSDGKNNGKKVKAASKKKDSRPAASTAAGLAWGSIYRSASGDKPVRVAALASSRQSAAHDVSFRREAEPRSSTGDERPQPRIRVSRDHVSGERIPAAHWREPPRSSPKRSSPRPSIQSPSPLPPRGPPPPPESPKIQHAPNSMSMPNPADFAPPPRPSIKPKPVALRSSQPTSHPMQATKSENSSRSLTPRLDQEVDPSNNVPRITSAPRPPRIDETARASPSSAIGDDLHRGVDRLAISQGNSESAIRRKAPPVNRQETPTPLSSDPDSSDQRTAASDAEDEDDEEDSEISKIMEKLPRGVDPQSAKQILNDIVVRGDEVHWDDIAGLEGAKKALKEAVVYPFLRPDLFSGLREPARGMLLFGPPGTGKTMLARAVATESKSTFFSISASSLTSKWHGESEKLVRALFGLAKALAPSIIFVDEIDSLLSARSSGSEHEASRRSKTEFLVQWSDLQRAAAGREQTNREKKEGDASRVLVLAATNMPWDIDEAARRRFVRRQYIPLPEHHVREQQIRKLISHQHHELSDADIQVLVQVTEGFSGSDITALAKDAAMGPLRNLGEALLHTPMDQIRAIIFQDFEASLYSIRPSVSHDGLRKYEDWAREFGERGG
ncbi:AAA family ATPase, putative [Penicillium digitatum]|uniref:AAA family ATPase, putative n=3 Tax=Penicillium digitatum TaxID=36651 RepID=K9FXN2_PEND2|nr:AAA family ATPase, putative [Penicillium digitatum Pd1]EKV07438.1 AAA family ATPase, putative [Penicillium digitatum PHI26]EKV14474.1 AAA family ATPase, putative [Penicillium digitatum Pd1]QQK46010.1 AAA family ATPase, putative [Penicillium digitatum]